MNRKYVPFIYSPMQSLFQEIRTRGPPPPNQYSPSFCHPDHIETKPDAAVFIHRFQPTNKQTANAVVALPAPAGN